MATLAADMTVTRCNASPAAEPTKSLGWRKGERVSEAGQGKGDGENDGENDQTRRRQTYLYPTFVCRSSRSPHVRYLREAR